MTAAEHKALLRRYIEEVWHNGRIAALDVFLAPTYRRHVSPTAPPLPLDGQEQRLAGFRAAFPDIELAFGDVVVEGDRVALRGIAPTGARVTVGLVDVVRIENGRIIEQWGDPDMLDLPRQLRATMDMRQERPSR